MYKERKLRAVVHGDDFTVLGNRDELQWYKRKVMEKFDIKDRGMVGPDDGDMKSIRILNRMITWEETGIVCEPGQRHVETIVRTMGVK